MKYSSIRPDKSLGYVRRFQELEVYKKTRKLAKELYTASKDFPREEAFSLTDQIRRSSRSIGSQIAEAWAKRKYPKHFVSKLTDADGEQLETQHWITMAFDCEYLSKEETQRLGEMTLEIGRMLGDMISKPEAFCRRTEDALQEESAGYDTSAMTDLLIAEY